METRIATGDTLHMNELEASAPTNFNENNVALVVLMGIPASGKSTLCKELSQLCCSWHTIVISFDDYVPLAVQANISQADTDAAALRSAANEKRDVETIELSPAKVVRKKFVHCVEIVSKFAKEARDKKGAKSIDEYLQLLRTLLCSYESENFVSNESFLSKVENIMKMLHTSYADIYDFKTVIMIDDNNYYHSMRNEFYQVAKQLEIGFTLIYCKSSLKTCVERNAGRPVQSQLPHKVIVEMSLKFEDPDPLKNSCDMYCVEINLNENVSKVNLNLLKEVISNSVRHPLVKNDDRSEEIERERRICSENEVHQADLVLRKWINKQLNLSTFSNSILNKNSNHAGVSSSVSGNFKKNLSQELNVRKKIALEMLRSGELKISFRTDQDVEFQGEIVKLFESIDSN